MSTLEELISLQDQLMNSVARTLPNFKKLGQSKMTLAVTRQRLAILKETFREVRELEGKIQLKADEKAKTSVPYFVKRCFIECEDNYHEAVDYMAEILAKSESTDQPVAGSVSRPNDFSRQPYSHLPTINLPSFDGAFEKWEGFRDKFKSMIHDDPSLSDLKRLHYLCSCLKGDASNALHDINITDANFVIAWNRLVSRYENKRKLITHRLHALFNLPSVNSESSKDLRDLRDQVNKSLYSLKNLGRPVDKWDDIIVFLIVQRLDKSTKKAWELKLGNSNEYPKFNELNEFLESRICALEAISPIPPKDSSKTARGKSLASHSTAAGQLSCPKCKANHLLHQCSTFLNLTPSQRFEFIKQCKRCINCFSAKHSSVKNCTNSYVCKQCNKKHHTLLHFEASTSPCETEQASSSAIPATPAQRDTTSKVDIASHLLSRSIAPKSRILLATARVRVYSPQGRYVTVRALVDQGSASTFISGSLAQSLRLVKSKLSVCVTGIGDIKSVVRYASEITITPANRDDPSYATTALILKSLTKYTPHQSNSSARWTHLEGLDLADREPMSSDPVDVIIGADLFGLIILDGVRKGTSEEPVAQNTTLGWILSGVTSSSPNTPLTPLHVHHGTIFENLDTHIRRFWEVEEIPQGVYMSPEEQICEEHFVATHSRTSEGRYVVRLPFKCGPPIPIGKSRAAALSSLHRLEHRFEREPTLATEYRAFMLEYERLGHMAEIPSTETTVDPSLSYYIPHHAVLREDSATTRLRVVFNASCRSSNGKSLNDFLHVGPKCQTDVPSVVLQWRQFRYVYTADIPKMYRQIMVYARDRDYQRILWRAFPNEPVKEYRLLTVTYGSASAPYLALRSVEQLAQDEGSAFPIALPILRRKRYIDDFAFGADDKVLARQARDQLTALLNKGGFGLRKWASNSPDLLSDIDPSDHGLAIDKVIQDDEHLKVLGITWNPVRDSFQFRVNAASNRSPTKRNVLATIARLYDPLGWVAPVIVTAKILMQQLWLRKCAWDDPLPEESLYQWTHYQSKLSCLEDLTIPRWTSFGSTTLHAALHGFSDASTKAYAAVVYLRLLHVDSSVTVRLLAAKTRVAPLKTLSIPRLELQAGLLLADLMKFVQSALQLTVECHCWTDSTITLAWLAQSPSQWGVFIANRVSAIQTLIPDAKWHHVPTNDNPADCASRGLAPDELNSHRLWWSGPSWLLLSPEFWPDSNPHLEPDAPLERRIQHVVCTASLPEKWDLASRFSSWPRLLRVTSYVLRFIAKIRSGVQSKVSHQRSGGCETLLPEEIHAAKIYWLKNMQSEMFSDEYILLATGRPLPKSTTLSSFAPYLDSDGLIRVRGRLRHSHLPESAKHPIILRSHPLLSLIINHHHLRTLHAGPQLTLASLRNEFWILRARATVRAVLYKCVKCARERADIPVELMGDLPDVRVNRASRAFEHTGVDYAGPVLVRTTSGRGHKARKAYIALLVCMTTKALHLELVSDYSSATFIAAFHRFVARRGLPSSMYSDNGTTFQGADREMTSAYFKAIRDTNFQNQLATDRVKWHFLPPSAPHFGGLWEAGVRSVKHHLKRCLGNRTFTFEELTTFLCQVEACLNSRPIAAVSENLDDYQPLTPGHFLIGTPLNALPEPSLLELNENRLSRWQLVQRCTESFWKAWSSDYLHTLQQRPKWRVAQRLAKVGQIVLVRNPLAPPSKWELGRVIACHPGQDGLIRVVTVKTSCSEYKRPLTKICFLPIDINVANSEESAMAGGDKP